MLMLRVETDLPQEFSAPALSFVQSTPVEHSTPGLSSAVAQVCNLRLCQTTELVDIGW